MQLKYWIKRMNKMDVDVSVSGGTSNIRVNSSLVDAPVLSHSLLLQMDHSPKMHFPTQTPVCVFEILSSVNSDFMKYFIFTDYF